MSKLNEHNKTEILGLLIYYYLPKFYFQKQLQLCIICLVRYFSQLPNLNRIELLYEPENNGKEIE